MFMRDALYLREKMFMRMFFFFKMNHLRMNCRSYNPKNFWFDVDFHTFYCYVYSATPEKIKKRIQDKKLKCMLEVRTFKKDTKKAFRANLLIKRSDALCLKQLRVENQLNMAKHSLCSNYTRII